MTSHKAESVAIIGAGLVGCVAAIAFAQRGYEVSVFDFRQDSRKDTEASKSALRSINLAISARGIAMLESLGKDISERVLKGVIPMKGRLLHDLSGHCTHQEYGLNGESIYSIGRASLNNNLLNELEAFENTKLFFDHKLTKLNFNEDKLTRAIFLHDGQNVEFEFDFIIGCDGAYSTTRSQMQREICMDYSQEYMDCLYLELSIPPTKEYNATYKGNFVIDPNYLHIWPRYDYMLIALPNKDGSFTSTFFGPRSLYARLTDTDTLRDFLTTNFPDAMKLMGLDNVITAFQNNERGALMCVECSPYHIENGKAIILGDAAHSMVPFYGQGMNSGFEDVNVLMQLLDSYDKDRSKAFAEYSSTRHKDLITIIELAKENYKYMSSGVINRRERVKRIFDRSLAILLKGYWLPLYTMISFRSDIPYHKAALISNRQSRIIDLLLIIVTICFHAILAVLIIYTAKYLGN